MDYPCEPNQISWIIQPCTYESPSILQMKDEILAIVHCLSKFFSFSPIVYLDTLTIAWILEDTIKDWIL